MMIIGRGAGIILISAKGKVLLQQRDENASWNKNLWSEFGGQIEQGETPEEAIKRELKEELGIKIKELKLFKRYNLERKEGIYEQFIFTAKLNYPLKQLRQNQQEGKGLNLFSFKEIFNLRMADYTKKILEDFLCQNSKSLKLRIKNERKGQLKSSQNF